MLARFVLTSISCLILFCNSLSAQKSGDENEIIEVVKTLFKGMEKGDSAMVSSSFAKEITMATTQRDKENNPQLVQESSMDGFLRAVGTPHPEIWYEEIWDVKVQTDLDFAQVWCSYAFYVGNKFSHCGVDAFHLHRGTNGWKIFHIADTRRSNDCIIPKDIQQKHKP